MMPTRRLLGIALACIGSVASAHAATRPLPFDAHSLSANRHSSAIAPLAVRTASALDGKLSAPLRFLLERAGVATPEAAAARSTSLARDAAALATFHDARSPFYVLPAADGEEPETFVFAKLDEITGPDAVRAAGGSIVRQSGDLAIVRAPIAKLAGIASSDAVRQMALSLRWASALDSSRARSRTAAVQNNTGGVLPQAYKGANVVVGVLDSGLDYTHADFRTAGGLSRLKGMLDFSVGTDGAECRVGQLDSLTCGEIDGSGGHGHGTHVTGIAAGGGRRNAAYVGMAPEADIVFVKGIRDAQSNGGFSDADVVNGTGFILDRAASLGKPCVVNLSLGGQIGAHDGTSLQEQFLDRFAGPGRIIVAAAGNSGGDPIHAAFTAQGSNYDSSVESWLQTVGGSAVVDIWAPKTANVNVGIVAYDPNTGTAMRVSAAAAPGQLLQGTLTDVDSGVPLGTVSIDARTTADPNNGDRNIFVSVQPAAGGVNPDLVLWGIYVFGSGSVDMWANGGHFVSDDLAQPDFYRRGDVAKTVGMPGTGKRIVCVGAHVSKTSYVDLDGGTRVFVGAQLDSMAFFSSRGPSRDGRHLPNFTAPGAIIISALSKDYPAERTSVLFGGGLQQQMGTSQAAPHVTGITALMLQRDPSLTPENVRTILAQSATVVSGAAPDIQGAGRVNALAALQATPDPLGCLVTLANGTTVPCDQADVRFAMMAYPNPSHGGAQLRFTSSVGQRAHLALYDIGGRRVRTLHDGWLGAGPQAFDWDGADAGGRAVASGIYFARLITPAGTRSIRMVVSR
ncbi:MAG: S8 family serine peptidase [Candidatus Eisenbacteria bacterium]